jgi:hypothetical protein
MDADGRRRMLRVRRSMTTTLDLTPHGSTVKEPPPGDGMPLRPGDARVPARRVAAGAVDALVLAAGFGVVVATELALASEEEVEWVLVGWTLLFAPLYFGLYHAWEQGATPGQLELRLALRDARTHARPTRTRALVRSYLGLAFAVLVLPAAIDLLTLLASGRSLRDRVTRTAVLPISLAGSAPELGGATVPDLRGIFEPPPGTRRYLRRGWALLRAHPHVLLGNVAAVYTVLVVVLLVTASLFVADAPEDLWAWAAFLVIAATLLASGVYWVQAVMVLAIEEARVGSAPSMGRTLVRAARRANALSAALVLLLLLAGAACLLVLPLLIAGRATLVAPALVLEDRRVLGAFRRSWQLTRGQTWRATGFVLVSALLLGAVPFAVDTIPKPAAERLAEDPGPVGWIGVLALAVPSIVAFAVLLAWLGAAWSLLYEDARRRRSENGR